MARRLVPRRLVPQRQCGRPRLPAYEHLLAHGRSEGPAIAERLGADKHRVRSELLKLMASWHVAQPAADVWEAIEGAAGN